MTTHDVFPSKYLKAGDLPEDGTPYIVTIEEVKMEEIGKNQDEKPVIKFNESNRGMVCNKTNWKIISKITGSEDSDDWIGKQIALYRAEVEFQGEMVEAIRVSLKQQGKTPPKPKKQEEGNDEVPF
jgi:hypothetical protein